MKENEIKLAQFIDNGNDLIVAEVPADSQSMAILQMKKDIKAKRVRFGTIYAIEETENGDALVVAIKCDNLIVHIPIEDFCALSEMKDTEGVSESDMRRRYQQKCSHMLGAVVSFIPLVLAYDVEEIPFVIASRKAAMIAQQKTYFFGKNPQVQVGSVADASIISVGPKYITVEWLGVETTIGVGGLSAYEYIGDVKDEYSVGQGIRVAVESLELDEENERVLSISLSHAMVERAGGKVPQASEKMIRGRYAATVVAALEKYYIVVLKGLKIRGIVPVEQCVGNELLYKGDEVAMFVTGVDKEKNIVIGKCRKVK